MNGLPSWVRDMKFAVVRKIPVGAGVAEKTVAVFVDPLHAETFCFERNREVCFSHPLPGQPRTVYVTEEILPS